MLNKLDLKNFDKVVKGFDFEELVTGETHLEIAHTVYNKIKTKPLYSEVFVHMLKSINEAYDQLSNPERTATPFFSVLVVLLLEN